MSLITWKYSGCFIVITYLSVIVNDVRFPYLDNFFYIVSRQLFNAMKLIELDHDHIFTCTSLMCWCCVTRLCLGNSTGNRWHVYYHSPSCWCRLWRCGRNRLFLCILDVRHIMGSGEQYLPEVISGGSLTKCRTATPNSRRRQAKSSIPPAGASNQDWLPAGLYQPGHGLQLCSSRLPLHTNMALRGRSG